MKWNPPLGARFAVLRVWYKTCSIFAMQKARISVTRNHAFLSMLIITVRMKRPILTPPDSALP
jgi:hypothetical protein